MSWSVQAVHGSPRPDEEDSAGNRNTLSLLFKDWVFITNPALFPKATVARLRRQIQSCGGRLLLPEDILAPGDKQHSRPTAVLTTTWLDKSPHCPRADVMEFSHGGHQWYQNLGIDTTGLPVYSSMLIDHAIIRDSTDTIDDQLPHMSVESKQKKRIAQNRLAYITEVANMVCNKYSPRTLAELYELMEREAASEVRPEERSWGTSGLTAFCNRSRAELDAAVPYLRRLRQSHKRAAQSRIVAPTSLRNPLPASSVVESSRGDNAGPANCSPAIRTAASVRPRLPETHEPRVLSTAPSPSISRDPPSSHQLALGTARTTQQGEGISVFREVRPIHPVAFDEFQTSASTHITAAPLIGPSASLPPRKRSRPDSLQPLSTPVSPLVTFAQSYSRSQDNSDRSPAVNDRGNGPSSSIDQDPNISEYVDDGRIARRAYAPAHDEGSATTDTPITPGHASGTTLVETSPLPAGCAPADHSGAASDSHSIASLACALSAQDSDSDVVPGPVPPRTLPEPGPVSPHTTSEPGPVSPHTPLEPGPVSPPLWPQPFTGCCDIIFSPLIDPWTKLASP